MALRRTLYLHVGQGKTGSSYLQSVMFGAAEELLIAGVHFPVEGFPADQIARGMTSSGNGSLLADPDFIGTFQCPGSALFSDEALAESMPQRVHDPAIRELVDRNGFDRVAILLFVRDPVEHAVSEYQQSVKRHGLTIDVDDFLSQYSGPARALSMIHYATEVLPAVCGVEVTLEARNYSRRRTDLVTTLRRFLGLGAESMADVSRGQVNRSLTVGETELQRQLNALLGADAQFLANELCDQLPGVDPGTGSFPSVAAQVEMVLRNMPAVAACNRHLPSAEQYRVQLLQHRGASDRAGGYRFTTEQLAIVARLLAGSRRSPVDEDHPWHPEHG